MKRYGNLWSSMISFQGLLAAAQAAQRGKRFRPGVASFIYQLETELLRLHRVLAEHAYEPSSYRTFYVYDPKKRLISAAPFPDRVVHHAITRVLEPIFERSFIANSFACRRGKGTHAAVRAAQGYARRYRYVAFPRSMYHSE